MMKKSLLLLAALVLGGCATHWPESALLNPQVIPSNQQYYSGNRITMEGVDKREAAYVFSIKKKEKAPVLVNSSQPLNSLLAEKLAEGLRSQGLEVGNSGTTNLTLAISTAAVTEDLHLCHQVPRQPAGDCRLPGQQADQAVQHVLQQGGPGRAEHGRSGIHPEPAAGQRAAADHGRRGAARLSQGPAELSEDI